MKNEISNAVRIKITSEMLGLLFEQNGMVFQCVEGLPKGYKVRGIIQDPHDACFYLCLSNDKAIEGQSFEDFIPIFKRR